MSEKKPTVPKTKVEVKKKLSTVQTYALRAAKEASIRASNEFQQLMREVAEEVGIDPTSNERWELSQDCKIFTFVGKEKERKDES